MTSFEPGKNSGNNPSNEPASGPHGEEPVSLPSREGGDIVAAQEFSSTPDLKGKLLERYLAAPDTRNAIDVALARSDTPLGSESQAVLTRFQAISDRLSYLASYGSDSTPESDPKKLKHAGEELISIARKECSPEEREVLADHAGHMAKWLGNDEAKGIAERVHKVVGEIGKNDLAAHVIHSGYAINDAKAGIKEGFETAVSAMDHAREVTVKRVTETVENTSKAIDHAKTVVAEKTTEAAVATVKAVQHAQGVVSEKVTEAVENTAKAIDHTKTVVVEKTTEAVVATQKAAQHAQEVVSENVSKAIDTTAKAIDHAGKVVAQKFEETKEGIIKGGQKLWSDTVAVCTKAFEATRDALTTLWQGSVGVAKEFIGFVRDKWEDATARATNVMLATGRALKEGYTATTEAISEAQKAVTGAIKAVHDWVVGNEPRNAPAEKAAIDAWDQEKLGKAGAFNKESNRYQVLHEEKVVEGLAAMLGRRYSQPGNEQGGWAEVRANLSDEQWSHRRRMATEHLLCTDGGANKLVELLKRSHGPDGRFAGALDTEGMRDVLDGVDQYMRNHLRHGSLDNTLPNVAGLEKVLDALKGHLDRIQDFQVRDKVKWTRNNVRGELGAFRSRYGEE